MDILVPKVGLTVETVEVLGWRKNVGETVCKDEIIVDVSADKADVEIPAPAEGILTTILVETGGTASPGEPLGRLGGGAGDDVSAAASSNAESPRVAASSPSSAVSKTSVPHLPAVAPHGWTTNGRLRVSPLARRLAAELGVSLENVDGSGPRGRIVRSDVERSATDRSVRSTGPSSSGESAQDLSSELAAANQIAPPMPDTIAAEVADGREPVRWTAARRATSRLMEESHRTVAPVTLHRRAAADLALRSVRELAGSGVPATFTTALLVVVGRALANHPALNARWEDETLYRYRHINVGVAVDVDGDLLSATVADLGQLDVIALAARSSEAIARTRARQPAGGQAVPTFSVSNLGMFGVEQFSPIVTPPQVAVLGVGAVIDGRCHLSLTFDHRAVDGAPAARFLAEVADRLAAFDGR